MISGTFLNYINLAAVDKRCSDTPSCNIRDLMLHDVNSSSKNHRAYGLKLWLSGSKVFGL